MGGRNSVPAANTHRQREAAVACTAGGGWPGALDCVRERSESPFKPCDLAVQGDLYSSCIRRRQEAHRPPTTHGVRPPWTLWWNCRNTHCLLGRGHSRAASAFRSAEVSLDSPG